ncbi:MULTISPECIES: phosphate signaling complex protein PhoU [Micromonospora]|uniref:Phosphate-specific transport system accessory protein PhoU n=1 Tax=Micromonospora maris TaxID=1003110 RepID=A0A9X0I0H8_9ACTN|nr:MULTISPECIES: phosphate signaling complex protein PhoU [Micromonospora]AEB45071.1 phosphate uptake regulator, PhoU [Micromonospora maris AB-18-032]KUJ44503.1 PhoU family transcriptional regulator [Micromonospora maris]RUL92347.1 phosphate signaling complex protein PhoU [Verrucosispora sp. FIM060022]
MGRDSYDEQLDRLTGILATMSREAGTAIRGASVALLDVDRHAAETVIADDAILARRRAEAEAMIPEVLVRHQPVASDLRLVVCALRIAGALDRMGDLAVHIAKVVLMRHPVGVVPEPAVPVLTEMADAAARIADKATMVLATRDPLDAMQLGLDDDEVDAAQERLLSMLVSGWSYGVESAIDLALVGRYYERYADQAVNVARQVVYLVTGTVRL